MYPQDTQTVHFQVSACQTANQGTDTATGLLQIMAMGSVRIGNGFRSQRRWIRDPTSIPGGAVVAWPGGWEVAEHHQSVAHGRGAAAALVGMMLVVPTKRETRRRIFSLKTARSGVLDMHGGRVAGVPG